MQVKNEDIEIAMDFLDRYKKYYRWSDDDIQEAMYRFVRYYNPELDVQPDTFVKICIESHIRAEYRTANAKKREHQPVYIDVLFDGTEERDKIMSWISNKDEFEFIIQEEKAELQQLIQLLLSELTGKQRLVLEEMFFNGKKASQIAIEHDTTPQAVYELKRNALNKLHSILKTKEYGTK